MFLRHLRAQNTREDGFTLIELLIVVLIIGILAAIAIPVYLGLQNQAKNNSTKQDTNSAVHSIQVALTEGQDLTTALNNNSDSANRSDGNQVVATPALDGSKNYTVVGTQSSTGFTYTYDSKTGQFTEGSGNINLGGGSTNTTPVFTSPALTAATTTQFANYNYQVTATGTPTPTYSITAGALPTGLTLSSAGLISGSPTATGTYNFTITASNGIGTAPTQAGKITVGAVTPMYMTATNSFDTTWTAASQGTTTNLSYTTSGMQLSTNSTTNAAIAYKDISGFNPGHTYQISMDIYTSSGNGYANYSGPGYSTTSVTNGPTTYYLNNQTSLTNFTAQMNFTPTTSTVRMWAVISNSYSYVRNGTVSGYKITQLN